MKIKFNWGTGIALFYSLFVVSVLTSVIYFSTESFDLVEENYYEKELDYQSHIDKMKRSARLSEQLTVIQAGDKAIIKFPYFERTGSYRGEIILFRPSDAKLDRKFKIKADDTGQQALDISKIERGYWKLKIDWAYGDSLYYNQEDLFVN